MHRYISANMKACQKKNSRQARLGGVTNTQPMPLTPHLVANRDASAKMKACRGKK